VDYDCLNAYKQTGKVKETTDEFHLDDIILQILQSITEQ
jgi:hypothetical protein